MTFTSIRWVVGILSIILLILFFLFQQFNFANLLEIQNTTAQFVFNKSFRFLLNDVLMIGLIFALFNNKQFVWFAFFVQVFGLVFILTPYLILKLYYHTGNGPLVSFLHRLILNPTLMVLLIPAFWLQLKNEKKSK